jgi:diadenosine tetraphosphatase ApaH/serine/threonine PP2A family protein phosphatase
MLAIVSDIHANFEALSVVLDDIKKHKVDDVICLGDVIGYGPNPGECVDCAINFRLCILGNHEEAVLDVMRAHGFNPRASSAVKWTAKQFDMLTDREKNSPRWDFLGELKDLYKDDGVLCVHGSPLDHTRGYIYSTDTRNPNKMMQVFESIQHICFVGHTHVPGVWTEDMTFQSPAELGYTYKLDGRRTIINVGSVGQPRDMDNRACYVLFDGTQVTFRKLRYPFEKTAQKIFAVPELDAFLGHRLREGR